MRFRVSSILLAVLVLAGGIRALEQEQTVEDSLHRESIQFRVMAFGDDLFAGFKFEDELGETTELTFNPYRRSVAYYHPRKERILTFFDEAEDSRGKLMRRELARVDVSDISSRALLVFSDVPDAGAQLPYSISIVDESDGVFGPGTFRFLNLTGARLALLAGESRVSLPGGFSDVLQFDANDRAPIRFRFAVWSEGDWRSVFSTRRQSHERAGTLFILKPPLEPDSFRIRVNALVENLR